MNQLITAFNGGEVTPLLAGRVDLPNMARACRIMRGFLAGVTGGAFRRPPLMNVGGALNNAAARLIPFNISAGVSFQIQLENVLARIWKGDGTALYASVAAPWVAAQLDGIQFVQSNDVMWLVHPDITPQELQHQGAGVWTLNEIPWKYPPLRDENLTATTIAASALTGAITLTASAALFDELMVGAFFEISHFRSAVSSEIVVPIIPAAAAILPFTVLPVADTTFSINGTAYTWKNTTDVTGPNQVAIDPTGGDDGIKNSRDNAIAAINAVDSATPSAPGFGIGTAPNPDVTAESGGDVDTSSSATGRLTCDGTNSFTTGTPSEFTIGTLTYRASTGAMVVAGSTYDFRQGPTEQDTLSNLTKAINLSGVAGTDYAVGTIINPDASAALATSAIVLTAKSAVPATGNAVATTTAHTGGHQTFGNVTLTGGTASATHKLKVSAKVLGDPGNLNSVTDTAATDHWLGTGFLTGGKYFGTAAMPATSPEITIKGQWDFTTYGSWTGAVYVEQKNSAGTWDVLRQVIGRLDTNRTFSGITDPAAILRIRVENMAGIPNSDVSAPRFLLEAVQSIVHGLVRITGYTSSTVVSATVINDLYSTAATPNWREGAFSNYRGFPAAVTLHEQRLIFAGNAAEPQKLWASGTGDFRNFEETGLDDGSWQYQLATQEGNAVRWVVSQQGLIIGTAGDEWLMEGGDVGITPSNASAKRQSAYGSEAVQAIVVGSNAIFIERGALKIREYVFNFDQANYIAPDITQLIEHLTPSGVQAIAHQNLPWSVIWAVTSDGMLLACTYARESEVIAWTPIPVDGLVKSVSVVYGRRGEADEVWIIVSRSGLLRIERLLPSHWNRLRAGSLCYHMDSAVEGAATAGVLSGLDHLNGQIVAVYAGFTADTEMIEQPNQVVSVGTVTVPGAITMAVGRIQPDSVLQTAIFDVPTQKGTSQGSKVLTVESVPRFYQTRACSYSRSPRKALYPINFRDSLDEVQLEPPPYSGLKRIQVEGNYDDSSDTTFYVTGTQTGNLVSVTIKASPFTS